MRIAMFPLATVLFPHMALPLHVFEERYRTMMGEVLAGDAAFGVVLIERGSEVGGGDIRFDVGTVATIANYDRFADGRYALVVVGRRRFRVREWLPERPYPCAEVDLLPRPAATSETARTLSSVEKTVRRAVSLATELGDAAPPISFSLDSDVSTATWQLCSLAPAGPLDAQRLLAIPDHDERLAFLQQLTDDALELMAQRLTGTG